MKIASIIAICLAVTIALAAIVSYMQGAQLPGIHRSKISITIRAEPAAVWAAITDYAAVPAWWPEVTAVRTQKLPDGTEITWNTDRHGREIPFRTDDARPGERLLRVIANDAASPGFTWEFTLAKAPRGGTLVTLTADGDRDPSNSFFRAIANWFFAFDTRQKDYLTHLQKHLAPTKP